MRGTSKSIGPIGILLAACLILAALPLRAIQAQASLPAEQQALLDRAIAAIDATAGDDSYEMAIVYTWRQDWQGTLNGQAIAGQANDYRRDQQVSASQTDQGPNMRQVVTFRDTVTALGSDPFTAELEGESRLVDGTLYALAAYRQPYPDGSQAVPDGWIAVDDAALFDVYPGLDALIPAATLTAPPSVLPGPVAFWFDVAALESALTAYTVAAAGESGSNQGETITLRLSKEAAWELGLLFEEGDPISQAIYATIEGEPLTFTFRLDADGRLSEIAYDIPLTLEAVDLGGLGDIPVGFTIDGTASETLSLRILSVDGPVTLAEAPALADVSAMTAPVVTTDLPWWNDRVFYEVFVRSFADSDGDGTGDLRGLIERLDYLNDGDPATSDDLGVTGLWLMPVTESPSYHGYDVVDYLTIEQDYGTNQDFKDLIAAAHARGMAVIVDLVMNHTSVEHPWFEAALAGDPDYADWYQWSATDPGTRTTWGAPAWHQAADGRYYYSLFWEGMPDLNYANPEVTEEMFEIIRFWLEDMGADGFRLDAIKHLFERGGQTENLPETLAWLEDFHAYVRSVEPDALTVGEVWSPTSVVATYTGTRVDIAFEFDLATAILQAAQTGRSARLLGVQARVLNSYPPGQYAAFLTNHDQDRVMNQLGGDEGAARVAATLLLTNPGVPFVYYGEEIGMAGAKPDERIRTPLAWNGDRVRAGFTTGDPWQRLADGYRVHNIALESADPASLLSHYRTLIHLRAEHPALRSAGMQLLRPGNPGVYASLRCAEDEAALVVVNLARAAVSDYGLSAGQSCLAGRGEGLLLLGEGDLVQPNLGSEGGLEDYAPLAVLPPQSSTIVLFQ